MLNLSENQSIAVKKRGNIDNITEERNYFERVYHFQYYNKDIYHISNEDLK